MNAEGINGNMIIVVILGFISINVEQRCSFKVNLYYNLMLERLIQNETESLCLQLQQSVPVIIKSTEAALETRQAEFASFTDPKLKFLPQNFTFMT